MLIFGARCAREPFFQQRIEYRSSYTVSTPFQSPITNRQSPMNLASFSIGRR
jgi:hypothetical protein